MQFAKMSKEALERERENRIENIAVFEKTLKDFPTSSPLGNASIRHTIGVFKRELETIEKVLQKKG
jgi:hypothetical protein